jgi:tetratricopeptide (TPR) repeat protein
MIPVSQRFKESDKLYVLAEEHLKKGDPKGAALVLEDIAGKFPNEGRAWSMLGEIVHCHLNDAEGSLEFFRKSIEVSPAYAPAYLAYADALFELEKFAEVNAVLNQSLALKGVNKDDALFRIGLLLESQERLDEAINAYKKSIMASFSNETIRKCEQGMERCGIKKKYT